MRRSLLPLLVLLAAAPVAPREAAACGPGVHVREADRVLDRLAAADEDWAALADTPLARAWLHLGAVAPDIGWAVSGLSFSGHDVRLSYHLLDAAEAPHRRLFALGHLSHQGADPACETFLTGTLMASAPLGLYDLLAGYDDAEGESEGLVEVFGDLVLGDYDAVVDLVYDFWGDGDAAKDRARAVIGWYCEQGAAWSRRTIDCAAVVAELEAMVARVDDLVAGLDRAGAHALVDSMIDRPLPQLADLFTSGALNGLVGDQIGGPSDVADRELARFRESALVDPAFWALYDDAFADLGPSFTLDRLALRTSGFPSWDPNSIVCGNVQSLMRFLPDAYDVQPGFLVDDVVWTDADGAPIAAVADAHLGGTLAVRVRWFAALPLDGVVRVDVRRDRPGLATAGDDVVASAQTAFAADPAAYVTTPRAELTVPFPAEPDGALGFTVDVAFAPAGGDVAAARPTFTSSWDRLWTVADVPLDRPVYQDNFGTYGHWPPSLPLATPPVSEGLLLAAARVPPAGPSGIAGATLTIAESGAAVTSGANGVAPFDRLAPGSWTVTAAAEGYAAGEPVVAHVEEGGRAWAWAPLHPVPWVRVEHPYTESAWIGPDDAGCLGLVLDPGPFDGQAETFLATLALWDGGALTAETDVGAGPIAALCPDPLPPDGASVAARVRARYRDGSHGVEGTSPPVRYDGTPPVIEAVTVAEDTDAACLPPYVSAPWGPPVRIGVRYAEPDAPITHVAWRLLPDGAWTDAAWGEDEPGELWFPIRDDERPDGGRIRVQIRNAALPLALVESQTVSLPVWREDRRCPASDVVAADAGAADVPSPDGATADAAGGDGGAPDGTAPDATVSDGADRDAVAPDAAGGDGDGGGGGCAAGGGAGAPLALSILLLALLGARRRAGRRAPGGPSTGAC